MFNEISEDNKDSFWSDKLVATNRVDRLPYICRSVCHPSRFAHSSQATTATQNNGKQKENIKTPLRLFRSGLLSGKPWFLRSDASDGILVRNYISFKTTIKILYIILTLNQLH